MIRRLERRRFVRPKFNLRKAMFVLPNLFTLSSVFCGFYAIVLASGDPSPAQMYQATVAVFFGLFFDMADGRVARLTRTQSDFGVQMDSLADVVTFGVAPAVIVHKWGLANLGFIGVAVAFAYVACGTIRLARFNVMASQTDETPSKYFVGLPIPLAAGLLVTLVMFHQRAIATPIVKEANILVLLLVLSYLMISKVRYRSFKRVHISSTSLSILGLVVIALFVVGAMVRPAFAMLVGFCAYVGLGLIEEVVFFRRRQREECQDTAPRENQDTIH